MKHRHRGGFHRDAIRSGQHSDHSNHAHEGRDDGRRLGRHERDGEDDRDHRGPHRRHGPGHDHGQEHGHGHRGHRGGRLFDYGELRLVLLAMIAERPRHGYELIKSIEERFGGSYSPSPGVIYPTLAWLDDMGYAAIEDGGTGRKSYRITAEGEAFLAANRAAVEELQARAGSRGGRHDLPAPILRAMENLKLAMRLRLRRGAIEQPTAEAIAAALDGAAQTVERS